MAKVTPGEFVRQVRAETAKVVWPSRKEVVQTTILVLIMTSILAVFFLGVDQILGFHGTSSARAFENSTAIRV